MNDPRTQGAGTRRRPGSRPRGPRTTAVVLLLAASSLLSPAHGGRAPSHADVGAVPTFLDAAGRPVEGVAPASVTDVDRTADVPAGTGTDPDRSTVAPRPGGPPDPVGLATLPGLVGLGGLGGLAGLADLADLLDPGPPGPRLPGGGIGTTVAGAPASSGSQAAPGLPAPPRGSVPAAGVGAASVPARAAQAYAAAALRERARRPGCGLDWHLLAGIGRVESDHGRYGGAVLTTDGRTQPLIIGIPLDGRPGVATIRDTDGGALDGDRTYDRAVGPMQFIPSTWAFAGVDGDGDGRTDPHDIDDAAAAAAGYLCAGGTDMRTTAGARAAVFRYNRSWEYVDRVLALAAAYATGTVAPFPTTVPALPGQTDLPPLPPASPLPASPLSPASPRPPLAPPPGAPPVPPTTDGPSGTPTTAPTAPGAPAPTGPTPTGPTPTGPIPTGPPPTGPTPTGPTPTDPTPPGPAPTGPTPTGPTPSQPAPSGPAPAPAPTSSPTGPTSPTDPSGPVAGPSEPPAPTPSPSDAPPADGASPEVPGPGVAPTGAPSVDRPGPRRTPRP